MTNITLKITGVSDKSAMDALRTLSVAMLGDLAILPGLKKQYTVEQAYGSGIAMLRRDDSEED